MEMLFVLYFIRIAFVSHKFWKGVRKMSSRQQIFMTILLFITVLVSSMQCNASFYSLPVSASIPDTFVAANVVEATDYNTEIKRQDSWMTTSVLRVGFSVIKQIQREYKSMNRNLLSILGVSLILYTNFGFSTVRFAMQETRISMPFQRLLHYIHNKDGKKEYC